MPYYLGERKHVGVPYQWALDFPVAAQYFGTAALGVAHASYLGKRKRDMPRNFGMDVDSAMSNQTSFPGRPPPVPVGGEDVQYVAAIRNTRSRYGKKRRKNLRNAWYELNKTRSYMLSRYQTFADNGFANALGSLSIKGVNSAVGIKMFMPVYCFRLSSLPAGEQAFTTTPQQLSTITGYRLYRDLPSASNAVYRWQEISSTQLNNTGSDVQTNCTNITDYKGPVFSNTRLQLTGFRHDWSDIKMTMYPQTQLPSEFIVRLVKFKEDLPCWPDSQGLDSAGNKVNVYETSGGTLEDRNAAVTTMWDDYFGPKLLHPHATNNAQTTAYGKLPFVPLRTERFYLPAREQTNAEAPIRLLHKHFFRNDRHYNSTVQNNVRDYNRDVVDSYNYYDNNKLGARGNEYSPFTIPGDEVWLMVEAVGYKKQVTSDDSGVYPVTEEYPSFDIVIRNKHSFMESDMSVTAGQTEVVATTTTAIEEEPDPTVTK